MTTDILEKMRERKKVKSNDQAKCKRLRKETEMDCRRAKDVWWHRKCEEVENPQSQHRTREMHEKIKEITGQGHKQKGSNCIKVKIENMLFDENEIKIKKIWEEYVTTLYSDTREKPPDVMYEKGEELSEVEKAIRDLKDKKALGKGDLTAEMIKALDHCTIPIVHRLASNIYKSGYIRKEMNE